MAIAIGDIHGCLVPLRLLIDRLPADAELVFLGDYIDRGPQSSGVVRYLRRLARRRPCRFLKGNHEDLMAQAMASARDIDGWLINGGGATLASYGLTPPQWRAQPDRSAFLGADAAFFRGLELYAEDAHAIYVHAGVDVSEPELTAQEPQTLLWIRERFFRRGGQWQGKPIVFGHTPTVYMGCGLGEVFREAPLTGIDTGCVYGGNLTALDTATGETWQEPGERAYA